MKKKIIAFTLVSAMVFSLAACGAKNTTTTPTPTPETTITPEITPEATPGVEGPVVITPAITENTAGSALWNAFLTAKTENAAITAEELANTLATNSVIQFMAGAVPVVPGWLAGFDTEITGFESGAMYGPMMGSIAFAGYVFELAEGADVEAFIKTLEENCNPRWNICVAADFVLSGAYGNTVFFLMYPESLDTEAPADTTVPTEAVIIEPTVEAGTWGETLWNAFKTSMNDNPSATAVDAAFVLSMHESIPFMSGSAEVVPGYLAGFSAEEMSGFKSGAMFGPMMGSIAFIGYVFELEEGADINAFMTTLSEQSNPRWNICVTADQTVIGAYNNMVFFLMCPTSNQGE